LLGPKKVNEPRSSSLPNPLKAATVSPASGGLGARVSGQFGEQLGHALAEKLSQSRFVGIARHLALSTCFSADGAAS
jgi:hypothetical protein